jgi:undecaprenyl-diphosphatase
MNIVEAVILGVVEGITEFLPISSTGHLTITEKLFGLKIDDPGVTAFTAIIQVGAILAAIHYFRKDIWRIGRAWVQGLLSPVARKQADYKFGWAVIVGSVPIGIIGLLFKDQIETSLRSLWIVAFALIVWSGVMYVADRLDRAKRHEADVTWKDTLFIGVVQCLALFPGVSRSGATISAGLFRGLDRVTVTRLSFFLGIPALTAAGIQQAVTQASDVASGVGWGNTLLAAIVSFIVAYASIAWLLKYVASHTFNAFIVYRVALGIVLIALLATGTITAH